MKEKSWEDIQKEYAKIRQGESEEIAHSSSGRWVKCSRCHGTGISTCSMCKGLGHVTAGQAGVYNASGKAECPLCHGAKQIACREYGCQNGWVWSANIIK